MEWALVAECKQKPNIEDETCPDPIDLKVGWIGEENGMEQWPRLYISDISRCYSSVLGKTDLIDWNVSISKGKHIDISQIRSLRKFYFIISQMNYSFVF